MRIDHLMAALGAAFALIMMGASLTYVPDAPSKVGLTVSFHGLNVRM
ncbi:hypothetical protein BH10PSE3_BH10PSE3_18510 [soil metagenome]